MGNPKQEQDVVYRMVTAYRKWYYARFQTPVQYSSQQAYIIEYNTTKGIYNMLVGSYRAKYPAVIPGDDIILGMWERMLEYINAKDSFFYSSLLSIHRNYNTIAAMMIRHQQKELKKQRGKEAAVAQRKIDIINGMLKTD